jgi:hypothetical protein
MLMPNGINQDVQNLSDAYRGNPEALAEKQRLDPQLKYLLALEDIRKQLASAKAAKTLAEAQQQAASGEADKTVLQQREEEVGSALGEPDQRGVAQQVGGGLQQQQGEQQAAMQKLMGGIAAAPGAQAAATPQAMAAGGIVAFNGEGPSQEVRKARRGYIIDPETGEERRMTAAELLMDTQQRGSAAPPPAPETESTAGMMLRSVGEMFGPKGSDAQKYREDALRNQGIRKAISAVTPGILEQLTPEERGIRQQHQEYLRGQLDQRPAAPAAAAAPVGAYRDESREDRRVGPIAAGGNPPPPPAVRRPAGPAAPTAPTMPAAPAALAGPAPEQNEMQTALSQGILGAQRTNPAAEQGAEYMRASNILGMSPQEKALIADNRAKTAEMTTARFDPEKQRDERLTQFLLGMGGQSLGSGALGAGATSSVNYRRSMEDAERGEKLGLMKLREGDFEKERGIRGEAYKGGLEALKQATQRQNQGVASGASLVATLQRSADEVKRLAQEGKYKELELRLKEQENAARAAQVRATQEGTEQSRLLAITAGLERDITRNTATIMNKYQPQIDMARQTVKPGDKQGEQRVQDMMTQRDLDIKNATENLVRQRQQVEGVLYKGAGPTGPSSGMRVVGQREK